METLALLLFVWLIAIPSLVIGFGLLRARVTEAASHAPPMVRSRRACELCTRSSRPPGARIRPTQLS